MDTIIYGLSQLAKSLSHMRKSRYLEEINSSLERHEYILTAIHSYAMIISKDVQRLTHMYLNSAMENLCFAQNSSNETLNNYIVQAKNRFIDASVIEKNENLIKTYLGLALCQAIVGEDNNVSLTLQSIERVKYAEEEMKWNCLEDNMRSLITKIYYYKQHGPNVGLLDNLTKPFQVAMLTRSIESMPQTKAECAAIYNKIREKEFNSLKSIVITKILKNESI